MPVTAGNTIAKILLRLLDSTLILLYSSLPLGRLQEKAREAGAHGYVQKTGNSRELVRSIEYWLNQTPWGVRATPRKPRSFRMV
jgi:hypothetical protein